MLLKFSSAKMEDFFILSIFCNIFATSNAIGHFKYFETTGGSAVANGFRRFPNDCVLGKSHRTNAAPGFGCGWL